MFIQTSQRTFRVVILCEFHIFWLTALYISTYQYTAIIRCHLQAGMLRPCWVTDGKTLTESMPLWWTESDHYSGFSKARTFSFSTAALLACMCGCTCVCVYVCMLGRLVSIDRHLKVVNPFWWWALATVLTTSHFFMWSSQELVTGKLCVLATWSIQILVDNAGNVRVRRIKHYRLQNSDAVTENRFADEETEVREYM